MPQKTIPFIRSLYAKTEADFVFTTLLHTISQTAAFIRVDPFTYLLNFFSHMAMKITLFSDEIGGIDFRSGNCPI